MKSLTLISELAAGGAERVTVTFMKRLAARGEPAHLATVTGRHDSALAAELAPAGVVRHDLGARRLSDPAAAWRLMRLIARERFTVLHAHGQDASILAGLARACSGRARLVITRHVLDEPRATLRQRLRARAALWATRRADAVIAVSQAAADGLVAAGGTRGRAPRVIRNGIDLATFAAGDGARVRASLGLTDEPVVLVVAVLRDGKGHAVLLDAVPALLARVPRARILMAGSGPLEADLRRRASGLAGSVTFLGHRDDVPDLLRAANVVALPSLAEALPTVLMEAAAAGRPVVATQVGGAPEIVVDGETGLLVSPSDAGSLAEALAALLLDPARAEAMGVAARHRARARFSVEAQVDATLALWHEVDERRA